MKILPFFIFSMLAIYAAFFHLDKLEDLFFIYAIISICLSPVIFFCICLMNDERRRNILTINQLMYSSFEKIVWLIIWGNLVINDRFWSGFLGISSLVFSFMASFIISKAHNNKEEKG